MIYWVKSVTLKALVGIVRIISSYSYCLCRTEHCFLSHISWYNSKRLISFPYILLCFFFGFFPPLILFNNQNLIQELLLKTLLNLPRLGEMAFIDSHNSLCISQSKTCVSVRICVSLKNDDYISLCNACDPSTMPGPWLTSNNFLN